jgi:hypothetical protein
MLEYTKAGDGERLAMLVLHDDAKREYAYGPAEGLPDTKSAPLPSRSTTRRLNLENDTKAQPMTFLKIAWEWLRSHAFPLVLTILLASCAAYGPYHPNTSYEPLNSVRGPADGRYKLAFIEFGDQGSALDTSQRTAALEVIKQAQRPLLFVYIHGWQTMGSGTLLVQARETA